MRELNVNEIEQVNGGNFFYSVGVWVGNQFKNASPGDVDTSIAP